MSENEPKPTESTVIWMIDEPEALASRAQWEEFLASMKRLNARSPHPQLAAAIARAEEAIKEAPVYFPRGSKTNE